MFKYVQNAKQLINICKFQTNQIRLSSASNKRFYKKTNILYSDGKYEVTLDQRKLRTPRGAPFVTESEALAIAVATEWDNQKKEINRAGMHLTALTSTSIDNPNHLSKLDIVNYLINYIATDTVLFHSSENDELYNTQLKEWDPILEWFNERYETNLVKSRSISQPDVSAACKMNISKYLMSYDFASLNGFVYAVDTLKSLVLTFACIDRHILPDKAVYLARLEEEHQLRFWERVEWSHTLSQQDLQSRLAASVLFVHFHSSNTLKKDKLII